MFLGFSLKWEAEGGQSHDLFVKKYKSTKQSFDKPTGKTLQIHNIPPYLTENIIKSLFGVVGNVERIIMFDSFDQKKSKFYKESKYFDDPPSSRFKIAYLVYKKSESVDLLFKLKKLPELSSVQDSISTGVAKWTKAYNNRSVNIDEMQTEIDQFMKTYDKIKKAEEEQGNELDDDGWVTVSKKGFKQKESVVNKLETKLQKQKKKSQLKNFYTFEVRESKKQHLIDLRKRFEEDKRKMETMKQARRFKPF